MFAVDRSRLLQRSMSGNNGSHYNSSSSNINNNHSVKSNNNFGGTGNNDPGGAGSSTFLASSRRFRPGDAVLVRCGEIENPVNRFGFPADHRGDATDLLLPEEQRGPYAYVLAEVLTVHFEEIHPFYTLKRCDTGAEQRADADIMEHVRTKRRQVAALRAAANEANFGNVTLHHSNAYHATAGAAAGAGTGGNGGGGGKSFYSEWRQTLVLWCAGCWMALWVPLFCLRRGVAALAERFRQTIGAHCIGQAKLFLYGLEPYILQCRWTMVNYMVLCSMWFAFMDQVRLAFLPKEADRGLAICSLIVWVVLVVELILEAFVRPDNYRHLIMTEKAYHPETMRYMNACQLAVEAFSLLLYMSEFWCIFQAESCSQRYRFSLYNALLMAVTGSTRLKVLGGSAYMALIRLRIFGLVRHWKNMWLNAESRSYATTTSLSKGTGGGGGSDDKNGSNHNGSHRESIKSASNIGTAILSNNTYNALLGSFLVTGLLPMLMTQKTAFPHSLFAMTQQLQSINLIAQDDSNATCSFLDESVVSWVTCLEKRNFLRQDKPLLLKLQIEPARCSVSSLCIDGPFLDSWTCHDDLLAESSRFGGIREGSKVEYVLMDEDDENDPLSEGRNKTIFSVSALFNQSTSVQNAYVYRTASASKISHTPAPNIWQRVCKFAPPGCDAAVNLVRSVDHEERCRSPCTWPVTKDALHCGAYQPGLGWNMAI
jgi:hypothetical protein